ncbi:DUF3784 domain-containing protein [Clostridium sp. YIM B02505]|uniref:DUF3784 domain-containing protein n=1 Tax=Clostridium yunnanense TaxID=2800325 RepID=A0ABS1EPB4_9CLOT|nr:DUF3784 domain-containing protein [Clostridium yunnanense]MBK1811169.1 DUF3784 domain-containing protein [Clostridium yunnanense]
MVIGFILITIFLAISIALINGKLSFLVIGYNTIDEVDKTNHDEKKLCKNAGLELLSLDLVLIIVMILLNTDYGNSHAVAIDLIATIVIVVLTVGNIILTQKNKKIYFKNKFKTKKTKS